MPPGIVRPGMDGDGPVGARGYSFAMIIGDPANRLAGEPEPSRMGDKACPRERNQQGKTRSIIYLL